MNKLKKGFVIAVTFFICLVATPVTFVFGMVYGGIKFVALTWNGWKRVFSKGE